MANFIAIMALGVTITCLLVKLVWQASVAVTEIQRIGLIVQEHDPKIDSHEIRITRLEEHRKT